MTNLPPDPILLELWRHRLAGAAEEMGVTLRRTAYSPNIKERLDFSCALFSADGRMVAQAAHIPAHLGAMPASVQFILDTFAERDEKWQQSDVVIVNDPFAGGNHLPDITMLSPVFLPGCDTPDFMVASRAHHADVGGMSPGSLPLSTEIYQEGIIIPPIKLYRAGKLNGEALAIILRNVRTPDERRGDLAAQRAAHAVGERRLLDLAAAHGRDELLSYCDHLQAYSERITRHAIRQWREGTFHFEDVLELPETALPTDALPTDALPTDALPTDALTHRRTDAPVHLAPIRVAATVANGEVTFDFAGSSPVTLSSLNAVIAITQSACYYAVRTLTGEDAPMNQGALNPIHVIAPLGSMVNATPPAAVAGGNVETSQRMTDVALGALAQARPDLVGAASQGTMNNLTIGGVRADGTPFAYYETIGGGGGATPQGDGLSGAQVHMTNTLNTPIEALELSFPFRIEQYALRAESGGAGSHRGGDGIVRAYYFLESVTVTMLSERRVVPPWGAAGGEAGKVGVNRVVSTNGVEEILPGKFTRRFAPSERLIIETPGGGGWGTYWKEDEA